MIKTMDGPIPNLEYHGIECPVKLVTIAHDGARLDGRTAIKMTYLTVAKGVVEYLPTPLRSAAGTLIYALPGGGQIDSGRR